MGLRGPPVSLDDEKTQAVLATLADGAPLETAAAAAGISRATLHKWLRSGARGETPALVLFSGQVRTVLAEWERAQLRTIKAASGTAWQAAAWLLERRYPKKYGRRSDDAVIEMKVEAKLKQLLKRARQRPPLKAVG